MGTQVGGFPKVGHLNKGLGTYAGASQDAFCNYRSAGTGMSRPQMRCSTGHGRVMACNALSARHAVSMRLARCARMALRGIR